MFPVISWNMMATQNVEMDCSKNGEIVADIDKTLAGGVEQTQVYPDLLGYGMGDRDSRVRFPMGAGNFSLHHCVQNGSGTHPASSPMGTGGSFPWG
jgi:hypothetical protein